jgi:PTS system nitrogen regulatory IIA component
MAIMYLNVIQLSESFGVDESVVEGWIRNESLPVIRDSGRLLFDRVQVIEWAAQRGLAAKAGFLAATRPSADPGRRLEAMLRIGGIRRGVGSADVLDILEGILAAMPGATSDVFRILKQRLRDPAGINWAPVGGGLALPHLRSHIALGRNFGLLSILLLGDALRLAEPAADGQPVTRLLFFVAPSPRAHLEMLARLSTALTRGSLRRLLMEAASDEELFAAVAAADGALDTRTAERSAQG